MAILDLWGQLDPGTRRELRPRLVSAPRAVTHPNYGKVTAALREAFRARSDWTPLELAEATGFKTPSVQHTISYLCGMREVEKVARGRYRRARAGAGATS